MNSRQIGARAKQRNELPLPVTLLFLVREVKLALKQACPASLPTDSGRLQGIQYLLDVRLPWSILPAKCRRAAYWLILGLQLPTVPMDPRFQTRDDAAMGNFGRWRIAPLSMRLRFRAFMVQGTR